MHKKELIIFLIYYMLIYMTSSSFFAYISVYYLYKGFPVVQIGILQAIGPILSIFVQPCWAMLSDRAKNRATVLKIVYAGCLLTVLLYPLVSGFQQTAVLTAAYMLFNTAIFPLSDALTVDALTRSGLKFSSVRMGGTIGFAVVVVICGNFFKSHISNMFYVNAAFLLVSLCVVFLLPASSHESGKKQKPALRELFRSRRLVFVLVFICFVSIAASYNSTFLGVRIRQMHYGNNFVGIAMGISALSEVPVLILISKYVKKFGTVSILLFSGFMMSLRMFICFIAPDIEVILLAQMLQGVTYMTIHYSTITFINDEVPQSCKSTGQSLLAVSQSGFGSIAGSVGGGIVSGSLGIPSTYLTLSVFLLFLSASFTVAKLLRR